MKKIILQAYFSHGFAKDITENLLYSKGHRYTRQGEILTLDWREDEFKKDPLANSLFPQILRPSWVVDSTWAYQVEEMAGEYKVISRDFKCNCQRIMIACPPNPKGYYYLHYRWEVGEML
jgi:hypothetical protein